jgi:4-hydroxybenzoate polyprenyltransferase
MTSLKDRLDAYELLLQLRRPFGLLPLLCPTLMGLWLATDGHPTVSQIILLTMSALLTFFAVTAFLAWMNHHRHIDPTEMPRLPPSPLTGGLISPWEALALSVLLTLFALLFLALTTKIALFYYLIGITLLLLYLFLRHLLLSPYLFLFLLLGILYSFGIPIAFAAVGAFTWFSWAFMGVNLFWVIACELQRLIRLRHMFPETQSPVMGEITTDRFDKPMMVLCYGFYFVGMTFVGYYDKLGVAFWAALGLSVAMVALGLLKPERFAKEKPVRCFSFFHLVSVLIFIGIAADFVMRTGAVPILK